MFFMLYVLCIFQGWEFAHSLIRSSLILSSLIRSFAHFTQIKWANVSESLSSLMSDHERFAQVPYDKWANERFAQNILAKQI